MLLYISGPFSGDHDKNTKDAAQIAAELWEAGHAVICPHSNGYFPGVHSNASYEQYLAGDLYMIAYCDALIMMENWETSKGAKVEKDYAEKLEIPVYIWPDYPALHTTEIRCPEQVKAFREVLGRMYRTHLSKNADYSPANILGPGEIGLATRLWDKITRYMNLMGFRLNITESGTYTEPKHPKHESIEDTLMDMAVYAIIGLLLRRKVWGK